MIAGGAISLAPPMLLIVLAMTSYQSTLGASPEGWALLAGSSVFGAALVAAGIWMLNARKR